MRRCSPKAERHHQSLQEYLTTELRNLATRRQISDVLNNVDTRRGGRVGFRQAADDLADERTGG